MSTISAKELLRVLERSKQADELGGKIAQAIELIEGVLDDLGEEAIAISFNGGKDCTVLLHLFAAVLYARHTSLPDKLQPSHAHVEIPPDHPHHPISTEHATPPPPLPSSLSSATTTTTSTTTTTDTITTTSTTGSPTPTTSTHHRPTSPTCLPYSPIRAIYITAPHPFPALEEFVLSSAQLYGLDLYRFGGGMKAALLEYLGCGGGKGVRGVLVGTRRGDPNGDVEALAPTDPSWPAFLRIHPILDWTYMDIWSFLRDLDVPYCDLYDEGYTSLGSTRNTIQNPLLKRSDNTWDPAWKLTDETKERAGRLDSSS
ncbi:hypothetical protein BCR39DRAFT_538543 [Naematelia encephala]|uniref:FAD synthase n=1 Tax=Naematelia encephala TaxID=71784 RepID=A0A1Y2AZT5_9TREE|nr:hypothetical protein BCR39DRAFT_538543 [Naematelia encephala]